MTTHHNGLSIDDAGHAMVTRDCAPASVRAGRSYCDEDELLISTERPHAVYHAGLSYDSDGALRAIDVADATGDVLLQDGLPCDSEGRIIVDGSGAIDHYAPGGAPVTAAQALVVAGLDRPGVNLLPTIAFDDPPWDSFPATLSSVAGPLEINTPATRWQHAAGDVAIIGHAAGHYYPVTPGMTYTWSFYARRGSAANRAGDYRVARTDTFALLVPSTSYAATLDGADDPVLPSGWHRIAVTFTVPAGVTEIECRPAQSALEMDLVLWGNKLEMGPAATGTPADLGPLLPDLLAAVASQATVFAHASVGTQIMQGSLGADGVAGFVADFPASGLTVVTAAGAPVPGNIGVGRWTESEWLWTLNYDPAHPLTTGALAKLVEFESAMDAGLGAALNVLSRSVVLMKIGFLDADQYNATTIATVFAAYQAMIGRLHASYPAISFVHVTESCRTSAFGNEVRHEYSRLVRAAYPANEVFDLERWESTDPATGARVVGADGFPALVPAFTSDGGHLTDVAGQDWVALHLIQSVQGIP